MIIVVFSPFPSSLVISLVRFSRVYAEVKGGWTLKEQNVSTDADRFSHPLTGN